MKKARAVIERRDSRAARWAARFAWFDTVLLLMAGLSHRYGLLETVPFLGVLLIGCLVAATGLAFAFAGFADLWERGDRGGRRALFAAIVCCILLSPFAVSAWRVLEHPQLSDVATDLADPPQFRTLADERPPLANRVGPIDAAAARMIREGYPDLVGRRYPVSPDQVMAQVMLLIADRGWTVAARHGVAEEPAPPAAEDEGGAAPPAEEAPAPTAEDAPPPPLPDAAEDQPADALADGEASIEVRAFSHWLRFPCDLVIRLTDEGESTFVDLRSASHFARHDLGDNAARIRSFLADLDARMDPGTED
ncbi:DUF1499 domain-containing protein [Aquibium microcysteis]|uniref:DUF1499 domain-containing protein n=1 Tax=Aquibium microcysteis TaxID=675281 RepID=UPI00165D1CE4|nr:DUF1499 domain-containing protein [Aquibium microcysteis]